jgi:hypothetical protein
VRCDPIFSGFMYLHLIMWFSYYTYLHLHLLRSIAVQYDAVTVLAIFSVVSVKLTPLP